MSTVNVVRPASDGSDTQALLLKMYSGSFTEAFRNQPSLYKSGLGVVKEISTAGGGKSWQFIKRAEGPAAEEFAPGDEMLGQEAAHTEGTITCDNYLVKHNYIGIDEVQQNQFDVTSSLGSDHSRLLKMEADKRIFITLALAARASAETSHNSLTVHNGGNTVTRSGGSTTVSTAFSAAYPLSPIGAANLRADLRALGYQMHLDNIPPENRYLWLHPWGWQVLLHDAGAIIGTPANTIVPVGSTLFNNSDYGSPNNINNQKITIVEGFKVVGVPNATSNGGSMPDQDFSTANLPSKYQYSFKPSTTTGTPIALAAVQGPAGTAPVGMVEFEGITQEVSWHPERLSWLFATRTRCGFGKMHEYCAGSVEVLST